MKYINIKKARYSKFYSKISKKNKKLISFNDIIQLQDNDLISISKIAYKFLDVLYGIENCNESEDLSLENYENLDDKDKLSLLSNIKFIKNYKSNYNNSENDINLDDNQENDIISDDGLSEDNNNLNNDSYILDEIINNDLFEYLMILIKKNL